MDKDIFKKLETENEKEYILRICDKRVDLGLTWQEISDKLNVLLHYNMSADSYRKFYSRNKEKVLCDIDFNRVSAENTEPDISLDSDLEKKIELQKIKCKMSDERVQLNAYVRRMAREETLKEIALDVAEKMSTKKILSVPNEILSVSGDNEAILELSDIHYGAAVSNYWNKYSPEIAKECLEKLRDETIKKCALNGVRTLHVVNLGDMINGYIHLGLRLESRVDVITQTIEISEILSEFLNDLSRYFDINFYSCLDNHSRLDPNKQDSMDLESLARIIPWYMKTRLSQNDRIVFNDNEFDHDIITFNVKRYKVLGVHGHKDKITTVVEKLSLMTHEHYDLVLTAHLHHFSCDEQNETVVVSNGSILGTDTYAKNLRLSSKPSQNLIIVTDDSVADCIYRIVLR